MGGWPFCCVIPGPNVWYLDSLVKVLWIQSKFLPLSPLLNICFCSNRGAFSELCITWTCKAWATICVLSPPLRAQPPTRWSGLFIPLKILPSASYSPLPNGLALLSMRCPNALSLVVYTGQGPATWVWVLLTCPHMSSFKFVLHLFLH